MTPKIKFSPNMLAYNGDNMYMIAPRKSYFLVPIYEGSEIKGQALLVKRADIFTMNHLWAERNPNWKYMVISTYEDKTDVSFYSDVTGFTDRMFKKMGRTKSPMKFLSYWFRIKAFLKLSYNYIEGESEFTYTPALS